jgi:hypothetical protein
MRMSCGIASFQDPGVPDTDRVLPPVQWHHGVVLQDPRVPDTDQALPLVEWHHGVVLRSPILTERTFEEAAQKVIA